MGSMLKKAFGEEKFETIKKDMFIRKKFKCLDEILNQI